uniref:MIF4G domain-containing protein n=1 Tax=Bartheletia paradoxa TaxID=669517 RepID=A0A2D0XHR0_9BASI|nr:hypothetical protein SPAR04796 [Bartheletia paradoxa]
MSYYQGHAQAQAQGYGGGGGGYGDRRYQQSRYRDDGSHSHSGRPAPASYKHQQGRGGRRDEPREPAMSAEKSIQEMVYRLGDADDFDPSADIMRAARILEAKFEQLPDAILQAFRAAATELPHKSPYIATLISIILSSPPSSTASSSTGLTAPNVGRTIIADLVRSFQGYLDNRLWREVRLTMHLFGHLCTARAVSASSLLELLQSFAAVLDEPGVHERPDRADAVVGCIGEVLIRSGANLYTYNAAAVEVLVAAIEAYVAARTVAKGLLTPHPRLGESDFSEVDDSLHTLLAALQSELSLGLLTPSFLPRPHDIFAQTTSSTVVKMLSTEAPYELPAVLVPPEQDEVEDKTGAPAQGARIERTDGRGRYSGARVYLRMFEDETMPVHTSGAGVALRALVLDIIDIYEVNRKEGAKLLLELPRWASSGSFRRRGGGADEGGWIPENVAVDSILSSMLLLPTPPHRLIYYASLLTEMCKISPSTVAPALGKSVRKLYTSLSTGTDVEVARRLAEWFSLHLSNFNFAWGWSEWEPDTTLPLTHPKRAFHKRTLALEVRLSYYDRIKGTVPESMIEFVMPSQAPAPNPEFDDPEHPQHADAAALLLLLRQKATVDDVSIRITELRTSFVEESGMTDEEAEIISRDIAVQSILSIGSRSFSHFLNATERYLPLLRSLTPTPVGRLALLRSVSRFWKNNEQLITIVFDKLIQYRIVEPAEVIQWVFSPEEHISEGTMDVDSVVSRDWSGGAGWDVLRMTLDKVNGRVLQVRDRLALARRDDEAQRAANRAASGVNDDDLMAIADAPDEPASSATTSAIAAHDTVRREQKNALVAAAESFVKGTCRALKDGKLLESEDGEGCEGKDGWSEEDWNAWALWGWWREFCRLYAKELGQIAQTVDSIALVETESAGEAGKAVRRVWDDSRKLAGGI